MSGHTADENGRPLTGLPADAMATCPECAMPLMPVDFEGALVVLECANRHRALAAMPADASARKLVEHRVAVRGAQIHAQRERRAAETAAEDAEETR